MYKIFSKIFITLGYVSVLSSVSYAKYNTNINIDAYKNQTYTGMS